MSFAPISFIASNYRDYATWWLKAYEPATTTPKTIALNSDGSTLAIKVQLNANGFPESAGGALVIPYISGAYDLFLFPTAAEADSNTTINALRLADNITADGGSGASSVLAEETKTLSAGQTTVTFAGINAATASIYIGSLGVDRGRLFVGIDYDVTGETVIELKRSFPAGTFCVGVSDDSIGGSGLDSTPYEFDTLADAVASTNIIADGKPITITERATGAGGRSDWLCVLSTGSENIYDFIQCVGVPTISLVLQPESPMNVRVLGIQETSTGGTTPAEIAVRTANSAVLNHAFATYDWCLIDLIVRTEGKILIRGNTRLTGVSSNTSMILGYDAGTDPTLYDATIAATTGNTQDFVMEYIKIGALRGGLQGVHMTPYQCKFLFCRFQNPNGSGFEFAPHGYQPENIFEGNYFNGCETGILGLGGAFNATDNYYINNVFYAGDTPVSNYHIRVSTASGTLFSGNHYYGSCFNTYVRLVAGDNIRFVGEYFEGNNPGSLTNPHVELFGGNPSTTTFTGCDFWQGDGANVDHNGDASCSIKITMSATNPFHLKMNGCTWNSGDNDFPLFGFTGGTQSNTAFTQITCNDDNSICLGQGGSGSYDLMVKHSGSTVAGNIVQSNILYFVASTTTQNESYPNIIASEIFSGNTGFATSFPVLPTSTDWASNKLLVINNISTTTALSFSSGATIFGLAVVPTNTRVAIIRAPSSIGTGYLIYKY